MNIFKTMAFIGEDSSPSLLGAIYYQDRWWIVATWLQSHATGERIPERLVQMDGVVLRFQEVRDPAYRCFLANNALPTGVLDGTDTGRYVIATYPALAHIPALSSSQ